MSDQRPVPGGKDWWREAVFYQIYPRSFCDSNGDGVGDLRGIAAKLPYIADLGVDAIWISPFYRSPMKDFGYDISDYCDVDPLFGSLADFDALLAAAHALGLRVIIDQVWSHTARVHPWFEDSAASREGPKADWYVWADAKPDGTPPNNWLASFGGPSWTWHPRRRQYYLHNFLSDQPDLNFWNPDVRAAILDVARFWLDRGVDGFRLDVINYIFHDRDLRDNPPAGGRIPALATRMQSHVFDRSRPEALDFLAELRALVDSYGARVTMGETVDAAALERQREYTETDRRLHTAYSFFLLTARSGTPELFRSALEGWQDGAGWPSWSLGNHDVPRFPTRLAAGRGSDAVKALLAVLLSMRGTPILYQGDELGLPQSQLAFADLQDPFAINAWDGDAGRDGARTPMPWTARPDAGFSSAKPWLPIDPAHLPLAVTEQAGVAGSVHDFVAAFLRMRRATPALRRGSLELVESPPGTLAFVRTDGAQSLLCLFELAGAPTSLGLAIEGRVHWSTSDAAPSADLAPHEVRLVALDAAIAKGLRRLGP